MTNDRMGCSCSSLDSDQLHERQAEEQRTIEKQIQAKHTQSQEQFGATLEKHRKHTQSNDRASSNAEGDPMILLRQLSLTEADRKAIERDMKAQHTHPLALQMQAEAEERRSRNEREYHRMHSSQTRALRLGDANVHRRRPRTNRISGNGNSPQQWNDVVNTFVRGGGDNGNASDDLVVLEAAILLSMEEEARRKGDGSVPLESSFRALQNTRYGFPLVQQFMSSRRDFQGISEEEQIAMAIALSMQEPSESKASGESEDNKVKTNLMDEDNAVVESGESSQSLTDQSVGMRRVGSQSESTTDRNAASESEDDHVDEVYFSETGRNEAALDSGDSFDDGDQKMPASYVDDDDQKMPASYVDDGDQIMPAS
jgi:Ubiquitin interaction motif